MRAASAVHRARLSLNANPKPRQWTDTVSDCFGEFCLGGSSACGRGDRRPVRERGFTVMNQVLQAMSRDIQGGGIHRIRVAHRGFGALSLQDVIDFFFDGHELSQRIGLPYSPSHGVQRIQRGFAFGLSNSAPAGATQPAQYTPRAHTLSSIVLSAMNLRLAPELHTSLPFSVRSSRGSLAFQQSENISRSGTRRKHPRFCNR
jgi:hypothetical protein